MANWNSHQLWYDCRDFSKQTPARKNEIVEAFKTKEMANDYAFINNLTSIRPHLNSQEVIDIFDNLVANYNFRYGYHHDQAYGFVIAAYQVDPIKVKNAVSAIDKEEFNKILLAFSDITKDEEVRGLRCISQSKYLPRAIYEAKYAPTKEALDELPPVMRLKAFETLTNNSHLAYNIFANFPDADEFKIMMFSSVMRHRERAEAIWNKYQEIAHLGQEGRVEIITNCANCGEARLSLKSNRVRTKTGLKSIKLWDSFRYGQCPLCGIKLATDAQIITEGIEKDEQVV